jgi:hypothetical protein
MFPVFKHKIPFIQIEDERALFRGTTSIHWTAMSSALITPTNIRPSVRPTKDGASL